MRRDHLPITGPAMIHVRDAHRDSNEPARPSVTIIVACRNESRHIRTFLGSLSQQDMEGLDWEIVIADGMSDDGTRELLEEYSVRHPQLRIIDNPGRIVSTGLNAAILAAQGEIVIRMDGHTEYAANYVLECVKALQQTGADEVGGPARTRAERPLARAIAAGYHSRFSTGGARFHDPGYEGYVDTVPYGCWRKSTLERLGLFDESLVRNQDDELNLRLTRSGGRIWQSPAMVAWYRPRATLSTLFQQYFQYGFWKVQVIRKHKIPASFRHLVPGVFVLTNVSLPIAAGVALITGQWPLCSTLFRGWLLLTMAYVMACLIASIFAARRHGVVTLLFLPVVFIVFHVSYGLGFVLGLLHRPKPQGQQFQFSGIFTDLTR